MLCRTKVEGFPDEYPEGLGNSVWRHAACFDVSFSSTPSKIEPLHILFKEDAKPVCLKHSNYTEEHR